jgi:AmmeMemoRadiSam system protein A
MSWIWAALAPHPPIIIQQVGQGREKEAGATLSGMKALIELVREAGSEGPPDVLFVMSPHLPYMPRALFLNAAPHLSGSLARFGAPAVSLRADTQTDVLAEFSTALAQSGIPAATGELPDITRDHGSIVPLYHLAQAFPGGVLPPVIMGNPSGLTPQLALALGDVLRGLAGRHRQALLASGDLSHRLKPDAPSGYSPDGAVFDQAVVAALRSGDPAPLLALSPKVRENAGECGFRPVLALLRLVRAPLQVLSYEGPFGVGYCTAFWRPGMAEIPVSAAGGDSLSPTDGIGAQQRFSDRKTPGEPAAAYESERGVHPYTRLARQTVTAHLRGAAPPTAEDIRALSRENTLWSPPKGCFVSIKNADGSLRGCIGTFLPTQPDLAAEIMSNAVAAATRDPRFPPMRPEELDKASFSVDVLSSPEAVRKGMELNPAVYGVIVSKGGRRGLLLPDLPGVTSVERQLTIAASKGGIDSLEGAQISRFTVERYPEKKGGKQP